MILLDVWFLQSIILLLVDDKEKETEYDSAYTKRAEHAHACLVCRIRAVELAYQHWHKAKAYVLDVEDNGVSRTQQLHGDYLRDTWPHGGRNQ